MGLLKKFGAGGLLAVAIMLLLNGGAIARSGQASQPGGAFNDLFRSCMNNVSKDCKTWALRGGGSDSPRGLTKETRAELAAGEKYILTGEIQIDRDRPFLRISFLNHPWLASAVRVKMPYYRINDSAGHWTSLRGEEVSILVTARYAPRMDSSGHFMLDVYLEPTPEPLIQAIQPRMTGHRTGHGY
ncbi:MAG: hypothetical protein H7301_13225 [Cryobacterium sp.]|nr:hypothetical protein [Oligoflexia bacterium]